MTNIVLFYNHQSPDYLGRWLSEIREYDHKQLEYCHDYIQVLFPNRLRSFFTPEAPILDDETESAFRESPQLQANLLRSLELMLDFYGFRSEPDGVIRPGPNFHQQAMNWLSPYNHNYLRITRILHCLMALGLSDHALQFHSCLCTHLYDYASEIGSQTMSYWNDVVQR